MKPHSVHPIETRAAAAPDYAIAKREQVTSRALFNGSRELLIEHAGEFIRCARPAKAS